LQELNKGHIKYLKQCFKKKDYCLLKVLYYILVVINQEQLDTTILALGILVKDLLSNLQDKYLRLVFLAKY